MEKIALIVAGGSGKRLNEKTPKQFLLIKNKPILMHTIDKFSHLDKIIVVISKNYITEWIDLVQTCINPPTPLAVGVLEQSLF